MRMQVSKSFWTAFALKLSAVSEKAGRLMAEYIETHGLENMTAVIEYADALVSKYGTAAAELSCECYDALAEASGKTVPAAEPAPAAEYGEVAKVVFGARKQSLMGSLIPSSVSRMTKQAGADTTLQNAIRDGAEWAWVPLGDTCAFCITLASRGWQHASEKVMKGAHAEHIHANCNCTFAVRFGPDDGVAGYDPDKYLEMYEGAEGSTPKEKINAMRREQYKIASERARDPNGYSNKVKLQLLDAPGFVEKFDSISDISSVNKRIYDSSVEMLQHRDGTNREDLYLIDGSTGELIYKHDTSEIDKGVKYGEDLKKALENAHKEGRTIIALHNHPNGFPPTLDDGVSALVHGYDRGVAVGHNLEVWEYTKTKVPLTTTQCMQAHEYISLREQAMVDFEEDVWYKELEKYGMVVTKK